MAAAKLSSADTLGYFDRVILVDFEYCQPEGSNPKPICMVYCEYPSGDPQALWLWNDSGQYPECPFDIGPGTLVAAYSAVAELSCFLALGWGCPTYVLDLWVAYRTLTNRDVPKGAPQPLSGLLAALRHYGLDSLDDEDKQSMRSLAARGGPYTELERDLLLAYCRSDVDTLNRLLPRMQGDVALAQIVYRGGYLKAVARMENLGIPIDTRLLRVLETHWDDCKLALINKLDVYGIFDGLVFKRRAFQMWLASRGFAWPLTETGLPETTQEVFHEMAKIHPEVATVGELKYLLDKMRLVGLSVGEDGRNRTTLRPFASKTLRNLPSSKKYIFGNSTSFRSFLKPDDGWGLALLDFAQQEPGIAGAKSRDKRMMDAYLCGDFYLGFAKQAGAIPPDGSKDTHGPIRERYKIVCLALQYGMGAKSLAVWLGCSEHVAEALIETHHRVYSTFWQWSQSTVKGALFDREMRTRQGWRMLIPKGWKPNQRSLMNWPMQTYGAEILQLACSMACDHGLQLVAPIHDAILLQSPLENLETDADLAGQLMTAAGRRILDGFPLRTETKLVRYPDRYCDPRGKAVWDTLMGILREQVWAGVQALLPRSPEHLIEMLSWTLDEPSAGTSTALNAEPTRSSLMGHRLQESAYVVGCINKRS